MGKFIESIPLNNPNLSASLQTDGVWVWDKVAQMNLAMKAKDITSALGDVAAYYQRRLPAVQKEHAELRVKVDAFLAQFQEDQPEGYY